MVASRERKSSVMRDMTTCLYEYEQEYNKVYSMEIRENNLQRESPKLQSAKEAGVQGKLGNGTGIVPAAGATGRNSRTKA